MRKVHSSMFKILNGWPKMLLTYIKGFSEVLCRRNEKLGVRMVFKCENILT